jgi:hypothetical protein
MQAFFVRRGDTLALVQGAGTAVEVSGGSAWMTEFGDINDHVLRDEARRLKSNGSVLIYAFQDCRVALTGPASARVQLRRRGEAPVAIAERPAALPLRALQRWFAFA